MIINLNDEWTLKLEPYIGHYRIMISNIKPGYNNFYYLEPDDARILAANIIAISREADKRNKQ